MLVVPLNDRAFVAVLLRRVRPFSLVERPYCIHPQHRHPVIELDHPLDEIRPWVSDRVREARVHGGRHLGLHEAVLVLERDEGHDVAVVGSHTAERRDDGGQTNPAPALPSRSAVVTEPERRASARSRRIG